MAGTIVFDRSNEVEVVNAAVVAAAAVVVAVIISRMAMKRQENRTVSIIVNGNRFGSSERFSSSNVRLM
jgi:hypothetical protein